ncbi:lysine N(6)-hydroxylase/L-ornithine N(5)-oxygenase family protein [Arenibacterium sp. LLYu02]|uniref:lysine N(6)-hydroxylase/L-ornithine N(5)-oxygenase family protein n=1 Tax=Arenibacterium sp. LLYu02 TaxID=3404132 RepID=UPI003B22213C
MTDPIETFDLLGIGFGPSNLALAIALQEGAAPLKSLFLEAKPRFAWHPGMLLDTADMQVSFVKDLVTLRNPSSPFTFLSYLHAKGRIERFVNRKTFFPSRHEFNDYFTWVAAQLPEACAYDQRVTAIRPVIGAERRVEALEVVSTTAAGATTTRRTRDLVLAVGGQPNIPPVFVPFGQDQCVLHSSAYVTDCKPRLAAGRAPMRIAVVGGGQSGAEIFWDLVNDPSRPLVDFLIRGQALKPSDDSPFVNEIFDSAFTSEIFNRSAVDRAGFLADYANTNYAVVDGDLIEQIYGLFYEQEVTGDPRHRLLRSSRVEAVQARDKGVSLTLHHRGETLEAQYDLVILATGYTRRVEDTILSDLAPWLLSQEAERDYQLPTVEGFRPRLFLQGLCEATHGLSDTLLSVLPLRAEEIATSLRAVQPSRARVLTAAE